MKNVVLILLILLIGCSTSKSEQYGISQEFKNKLTGIWISNEYTHKLFETNSVTITEASIRTYTDIVFDGDSTLYCNRPDLMEEHYLYITRDSSIISYQGDVIFNLTKLSDSLMTLVDQDNFKHDYSKVSKSLDDRNIRFDVVRGSQYIRRKWIAGKYTFVTDSQQVEFVIDNSGKIEGSKLFVGCDVFSYEASDLIVFKTPSGSKVTYKVDETDGTTFVLDEVNELVDEGQPLKSKGRKGKLVKRK